MENKLESRTEKNKTKQEDIDEEEKKQKRKKIAKRVFLIFFALFILFSISYFYLSFIATKWIIVKETVIKDPELPESFVGKKIIQFSDLHYGSTIFLEDVKKIVKEINKRNPDLVFFTGDLIDKNYDLQTKESEEITEELKKINASIGKYAVSGEEDIASFQTIMNQSDFTILSNDYDLVYTTDQTPILVVGLGSLTTDRNIDKAYRYFKEENHNANIYTISLLHEADSIDEIKTNYKTNLALAGHSHNGQINVPLLGNFIKKEGSTKYFQEYYHLENTELYISSGLGCSNILLRFNARPSISFFRLQNS